MLYDLFSPSFLIEVAALAVAVETLRRSALNQQDEGAPKEGQDG